MNTNIFTKMRLKILSLSFHLIIPLIKLITIFLTKAIDIHVIKDLKLKSIFEFFFYFHKVVSYLWLNIFRTFEAETEIETFTIY